MTGDAVEGKDKVVHLPLFAWNRSRDLASKGFCPRRLVLAAAVVAFEKLSPVERVACLEEARTLSLAQYKTASDTEARP